jgi:hypothetical protein
MENNGVGRNWSLLVLTNQSWEICVLTPPGNFVSSQGDCKDTDKTQTRSKALLAMK